MTTRTDRRLLIRSCQLGVRRVINGRTPLKANIPQILKNEGQISDFRNRGRHGLSSSSTGPSRECSITGCAGVQAQGSSG